MDFQLNREEEHRQRQACDLLPSPRAMKDVELISTHTIDGVFAQAYSSGLGAEFGAEVEEYTGLFLQLEALAKGEPELAFALSYHFLCKRVAAVLFEKELYTMLRRPTASCSAFDMLLIWPQLPHESSISGAVAQFSFKDKWLSAKDPFLPLPSFDDVVVLGWAAAGDGSIVAFCVPTHLGPTGQKQSVRSLGLHGIGFQRWELNTVLENGMFHCVREFPRKYRQLETERALLCGAVVSGLLHALLAYAVNYSRKRKTFGKPILLHQAVAMNLAEMKVETEAMRLVLLDQAQCVARNEMQNCDSQLRRYLAEGAAKVSNQAQQVLGGHGLLHNCPAGKWVRDIQTLLLLLG